MKVPITAAPTYQAPRGELERQIAAVWQEVLEVEQVGVSENFFDLGGRLMLVDLPGYGFAKAPKAAVDAWTRLIRAYLKGRPNLIRINLLIDSRHGIKDVDEDFMSMLDQAAVVYQIVLTKTDKLKAGQLEKLVATTEEKLRPHVAAYPRLFTTSSEKGDRISELRAELATLAT